MERLVNLPATGAYTGAAAPLVVPLDQLPPGFRLRALICTLILNVTQSAAAAAVTGASLNKLFAMLTIGKRFRATGAGLNALVWAMLGRDFSITADIPATNSTAFLRHITVALPFGDLDAYEPDDMSPQAALFKDQPLNVDLAAVTDIGATLTGALTASLVTTAVLEKGDPRVVATPQRINFADYSGQQVRLPPGSYTHILAYKEDGSDFTAAEVSAISMTVDGEPVMQRTSLATLAAIFNYQKAKGSARQALSATAPVVGEGLPDQPAVTGTTSAPLGPFVPIYIGRTGHKLSKALHSRGGVTIDFEGTLTSFRIIARRAEPQSADQVVRAGFKQGVRVADVKPKTASKRDVPDGSYTAHLLPKRVG